MQMVGKNAKLVKRRQEYNDGETWLVSYADMMTLLFAFFVILYSMSSLDNNKFNDIGKELAEAFKGDVKEIKSESEVGMMMQARQIRALQLLIAMLNLGETEKVVDEIEKAMAENRGLEAARKTLEDGMKSEDNSLLERLRLKTVDKEDRVELALPGEMLFRSGTATLTPEAKAGLKRIARYLSRIEGLVGLEVVGHTDSAPPSRRSLFPSNWALSAARAGAVTETLLQYGINRKNILTRGMADLEPMFVERRPNGSLIRENMAKNRRVHIIIKKAKD